MQRFAVSQKNRAEATTISPFLLSLPYRTENRRFSALSCTKTGGTQPKLSAACFVVQSCLADADFVVFSNYCLIGTRRRALFFALLLNSHREFRRFHFGALLLNFRRKSERFHFGALLLNFLRKFESFHFGTLLPKFPQEIQSLPDIASSFSNISRYSFGEIPYSFRNAR